MAERGNGVSAESPAAATDHAPPPSAGGEALDLKARLERFGEILARGLDLAEAGMNLGLTIVSTVGSAAQQKIVEKLLDPGTEPEPMPPPPAAEPEPQPYGIANRLPVFPGGAVSISFSINNDSAIAPKSVSLRLEGFAPDQGGAALPADGFRLLPPEAAIAAMDFEKFVIEGTIPAGTRPGTYRGHVLVASDTNIVIPVSITVQAGPSGDLGGGPGDEP
jgi:hypothetical protein